MRGMLWIGCLMIALAGTAKAQQTPAGTHSVDEPPREDAVNQQIRDAESDLEKQDYKAAEAKLKEIAAKRPKDAQVLYDLGFSEESNGEESEAAKVYAAAVTADANFVEPAIALGLLDARAGRVDAAHRELQTAANVAGSAPQLRGRALRALARLDEAAQPELAREELLAAVQLTGETPEDVAMAADLADRAGDAADAETAYRRALALTPGDVDASAGLAHALQREGKTADAEELLLAAIKEHPGDPRLVSQLASVDVAEGKAEQAVPLMEQLRAGNQKLAADPAMTRLLAQLYAMTGNNPSAEKLYAGLVATNPQDPALLDDLGSVLVKEQRYAEAETLLAKAVGMRAAFHDDPEWGEAAGHLAFAASKDGHPQITLQALAARATVLPNTPASLFLEATAHDSLHQYRDAERCYRAFLAVANGKFPDEEFQARHRLVALAHMR